MGVVMYTKVTNNYSIFFIILILYNIHFIIQCFELYLTIVVHVEFAAN